MIKVYAEGMKENMHGPYLPAVMLTLAPQGPSRLFLHVSLRNAALLA